MKNLLVIILALFVGFAYAENENVPTSKKFVDAALAQKQPKFEALGNDKLMLYSDTTDGAVTSRDIVTTLGTGTSADTVPTVGAINAGLATKQDVLNGPSGWVAENTGVAGAVVQKPVYSATNNYSNALVEVETLNNAVINAVNSELTVVPGVGWTINTANNLNLLPVPKTYNPYLPDGYTQLEYLESTRGPLIDTDFSPTENTRVDYKVKLSTRRGELLIGARVGDNINNRFFPIGYQEGNTLRLTYGIWEHRELADYSQIYIGSYQPGNGFAILNNVTYNIENANFVKTQNNNLILFGASGYGEVLSGAGQIYYVQIYEQNTLVRNFIPVRRNSDGELGMYDTVSDTFFTNTGSGTFTAGPDVYF